MRPKLGRGVESGQKRRRARKPIKLLAINEHTMPIKSIELAWAAGFFCGEGSTVSGWSQEDEIWRVLISVGQTSTNGTPQVLTRFQRAVGLGTLYGPYGSEYYVRTNDANKVLRIIALLWPWLSRVKREQAIAAFGKISERLSGQKLDIFLREHGIYARPPAVARTESHRVAWAAGLFDGEGSTWADLYQGIDACSYTPVVCVRQSSGSGIPEVLTRFKRAVGGLGKINGPWSEPDHTDSYQWRLTGRRAVMVLKMLENHWGPVKRAQARRVMALVENTPKPYVGGKRKTVCIRGHLYPKERIRLASGSLQPCIGCRQVYKLAHRKH